MAQAGAIGSVSPLGSGGTVASCWVTQSGTTMTVRPVDNINNNTGMAFDAGYDGVTDSVLISGDGSKGAEKSAKTAPGLNRPLFPAWPVQAAAGTGATSGGVSINGLNSAVVTGAAFGGTANDVAVMLSFSGGGRMVASSDGGATWFTLSSNGGSSTDYWASATSGQYWILGGSDTGGNLLSALAVSPTNPLSGSSVANQLPSTNGNDLGATFSGMESPDVTAIRGLAGTDSAFVGTTVVAAGSSNRGGGSLVKVTLFGSGFSSLTGAVSSLAYCPVAGSDDAVKDTLFVALGASTIGGSDGGVAVFSTASSNPVAKTVTAPPGDFSMIRVACASGAIYAAATVAPGASGLMKSTDGGATFTAVPIGGSTISPAMAGNLKNLVVVAIDPSSPSEIVVADGQGDVAASADGGATWTAENDTSKANAKHFGGERPGDILIPPGGTSHVPVGGAASARRAQSSISTSQALVGSGAGLFSASVRPNGSSSSHFVYLPAVHR